CPGCSAGRPSNSPGNWAPSTNARSCTATTSSYCHEGVTPMSVLDAARRAREAATLLAVATRSTKDAALHAMADTLVRRTPEILAANEQDVAAAREAGIAPSLVDRLMLTEARVRGMADGLRQVAALPDPVGEVVRGTTLPNGLRLRQVRVPLGVVGIIYEARPNVTVDAAGLC